MIIAYPQVFTPQSSPSYSNVVTVPMIINCPANEVFAPPFIDEISDGYNCTRCAGEPIYHMLFERGDIIPLQLRELDQRNVDVANPSQGWRDVFSDGTGNWYVQAKLLDFDCTTVLSEIVDDFCSDWWVGFDQKTGSIQTLFIDTDKLPVGQEFFRLEVNFRDAGGGIINTIYTEPFRVVDCENTVELTGQISGLDCLGRYNSQPNTWFRANQAPTYLPTLFYPWLRLQADLVLVGTTNETQRNDADIVVSSTYNEQYQLKCWPVPPYMARMLASFGTCTSIDMIDQFNNPHTFTAMEDFAKGIEEGYLFKPEVTFSKQCKRSSFTCD